MNKLNLTSKFARDTASLISAQGIITIITFANAVVMARALGPEGRGQFSIALFLPYLLISLTDFGLPSAGTKIIASRKWSPSDILSSHVLAGIVRVLVVGLMGVGIVYVAGDEFFPNIPIDYLLLGLLLLVPLTIAGFMLPLVLGFGLGQKYSQLLLISSFISFFTLFTAYIVITELDVTFIILLQIFSGLISAAIILVKTKNIVGGFGQPSADYLAGAFRFGFGIYLSSLSTFANSKFILVLINSVGGAYAVGLYTIAQTATERLFLLADSIGTMLLPAVADSPDHNSAKLTPIVFRITLFILTFFSVIIGLIARWFIPLVFTEAFSGAVPVLYVLLISTVFSGGWRVISQDINARGRTGLTAIVNSISALISLGSSFVMLFNFGVIGAAFGSLISSIFSLLIGLFLYNKLAVNRLEIKSLFVINKSEREFIKKIFRGIFYATRLGPRFWWILSRVYLLDRISISISSVVVFVKRRISQLWFIICMPYYINWAKKLQTKINNNQNVFNVLSFEELGVSESDIKLINEKMTNCDIVELGKYDNYGRLISGIVTIDEIVCCDVKSYRPRERTNVSLVATHKGIGIEKKYFGKRAFQRFLCELRALILLRNTEVRTPKILYINVDKISIIEAFVPGKDLEQILVGMGAELSGEALRSNLGKNLNSKELINAYYNEGAKYALQLSPTLIGEIYKQIIEAHRHGLELYDIKFGNIIVHNKTGLPYLIDFDSSRIHTNKSSRCFLIERDRDIEKLNRMLGTEFLTYKRLFNRLKYNAYPASERTYASFYIGHGLRIGKLWDRSIGFGRWHYILRRCLKLSPYSRVLSIGANNASIEIQLLREGVSEVVAYEIDEGYGSQADFIIAASEWADNRKYNLKYVKKDMREVANLLGNFDCTIALCSLYYLPANEMEELASCIFKISKRFVLQCNISQNIEREDHDEYRRASVEFSLELLKKSGFSEVVVTAPRGYSRPIVDGKKL